MDRATAAKLMREVHDTRTLIDNWFQMPVEATYHAFDEINLPEELFAELDGGRLYNAVSDLPSPQEPVIRYFGDVLWHLQHETDPLAWTLPTGYDIRQHYWHRLATLDDYLSRFNLQDYLKRYAHPGYDDYGHYQNVVREAVLYWMQWVKVRAEQCKPGDELTDRFADLVAEADSHFWSLLGWYLTAKRVKEYVRSNKSMFSKSLLDWAKEVG